MKKYEQRSAWKSDYDMPRTIDVIFSGVKWLSIVKMLSLFFSISTIQCCPVHTARQQPEKPVEHYQIFPSTELNSSQVTDSHSVDVETLRRKSVESPARWDSDDVKDKHSYEQGADHHHFIQNWKPLFI